MSGKDKADTNRRWFTGQGLCQMLSSVFPGSEGQDSCGDLGGSQVTRGLNSGSLPPLGASLACTQAETAISHQLGIETY